MFSRFMLGVVTKSRSIMVRNRQVSQQVSQQDEIKKKIQQNRSNLNDLD